MPMSSVPDEKTSDVQLIEARSASKDLLEATT